MAKRDRERERNRVKIGAKWLDVWSYTSALNECQEAEKDRWRPNDCDSNRKMQSLSKQVKDKFHIQW